MASLQILLVDVCATRCAIRRSAVREILPLPNLWQPPALPRPVAGFFSLGGTAVAVVRLDLLFGLADGKKAEPPGLYGHLILVRGSKAGQPVAFLAERVVDLAEIDDRELCPVPEAGTLNGCVEAQIDMEGRLVHLLSVENILFAEEQQTIASLAQQAQERLGEWEVTA
jgi:purine-binding chemotaxis protein CheW